MVLAKKYGETDVAAFLEPVLGFGKKIKRGFIVEPSTAQHHTLAFSAIIAFALCWRIDEAIKKILVKQRDH